MSDVDWPSPDPAAREPESRAASPLPRIEDLPVAEQGYDREKVREAFDAFYRHAAQLDATLRTLEAVEVFQRTAAELRAELRTVRGSGWTVQSWQAYGARQSATEWSLPPAFPRIALEALFLIVVGVIAGVAGWSRLAIVLVMSAALAIVWLIEWLAARERAIPTAAAPAVAPVLDEPAPVAAEVAPAVAVDEEAPDAMTIFDEPAVAEAEVAVDVEEAPPQAPPVDAAMGAADADVEWPAAEALEADVEAAEVDGVAVVDGVGEAVEPAVDEGVEVGATATPDDDPLAAVADELEPGSELDEDALGGAVAEPVAPERRRWFHLFRRREPEPVAADRGPEEPGAEDAAAEAPDEPVELEAAVADVAVVEPELEAEPEPAAAEGAVEDEAARASSEDAEAEVGDVAELDRIDDDGALASVEADAAADGDQPRDEVEPPLAEDVAEPEEPAVAAVPGDEEDEDVGDDAEPLDTIDPWEQEPELPEAAADDVDVAPPDTPDEEPRARFGWFRRSRRQEEPRDAATPVVDSADGDGGHAGSGDLEQDLVEALPEPIAEADDPDRLDAPEPELGTAEATSPADLEPESELEPEPQDLPVEVLAEQAAAALQRSRARRRSPRRGRRR